MSNYTNPTGSLSDNTCWLAQTYQWISYPCFSLCVISSKTSSMVYRLLRRITVTEKWHLITHTNCNIHLKKKKKKDNQLKFKISAQSRLKTIKCAIFRVVYPRFLRCTHFLPCTSVYSPFPNLPVLALSIAPRQVSWIWICLPFVCAEHILGDHCQWISQLQGLSSGDCNKGSWSFQGVLEIVQEQPMTQSTFSTATDGGAAEQDPSVCLPSWSPRRLSCMNKWCTSH